jgi:hypothetical protein
MGLSEVKARGFGPLDPGPRTIWVGRPFKCGSFQNTSAVAVLACYNFRLQTITLEAFGMALIKNWNGNALGTNTGKMSVTLVGEDSALTGTLRFADADTGFVVYAISGSFDGGTLKFTGEPTIKRDGLTYGTLSVKGMLKSDGSISGEWETKIGSGGTFFLLPHDTSPVAHSDASVADQLHTKHHNFGPIVVERKGIIGLAESIQRELPKSRVIITFTTSTEQSRYLEAFKLHTFTNDKVEFLKIYAREPEGTGTDKIISIEFGQFVNVAMTQGSHESWVLGTIEKLKHEVGNLQRHYANRKLEGAINQAIVFAAIAYSPSLDNFQQRLVLIFGAVLITIGASRLHQKVLPNAVIYVGDKTEDKITSAFISAGGWLVNILAAALTAIIVAYFKGMFRLSSP